MKWVKGFVGVTFACIVIFAFLPLLPALIHDIIVITWASAPWWGQMLLVVLGLLIVAGIVRCAVGFIAWLLRPLHR